MDLAMGAPMAAGMEEDMDLPLGVDTEVVMEVATVVDMDLLLMGVVMEVAMEVMGLLLMGVVMGVVIQDMAAVTEDMGLLRMGAVMEVVMEVTDLLMGVVMEAATAVATEVMDHRLMVVAMEIDSVLDSKTKIIQITKILVYFKLLLMVVIDTSIHLVKL